MAGICLGQIVMPLLSTWLQTNFGYRGATLLYGAIILNSVPVAALFHPVEEHSKKLPREKKENKTFTNPKAPSQSLELETEEEMSLVSKSEVSVKPISLKLSPEPSILLEGSVQSLILQDAVKSQDNQTIPNRRKSEYFLLHLGKRLVTIFKKHLTVLRSARVKVISISYGLFVTGYVNFLMMVPFSSRLLGHDQYIAAW